MATIRYKGKKEGGMPVTFPIGVHKRTKIQETKFANPDLEMSDEDAEKLIKLDPHNFELAKEEKKAMAHDPKEVSKKEVEEKEKVGTGKAFPSKTPSLKDEDTAEEVAKKVDSVTLENLEGKTAPDGLKPAALDPAATQVGKAVSSNPGGRVSGIEHPMPASIDPTAKQQNAPVENPGRDDARDPNTAATGDPETKEALKEDAEAEAEAEKETVAKKRGRKPSDKKE